jgi:hypothetical protein
VRSPHPHRRTLQDAPLRPGGSQRSREPCRFPTLRCCTDADSLRVLVLSRHRYRPVVSAVLLCRFRHAAARGRLRSVDLPGRKLLLADEFHHKLCVSVTQESMCPCDWCTEIGDGVQLVCTSVVGGVLLSFSRFCSDDFLIAVMSLISKTSKLRPESRMGRAS